MQAPKYSKSVQRTILTAVSAYTRHFPIGWKKDLLQRAALRLAGLSEVTAECDHGGRVLLRFPQDRGMEDAFFRHSLETGTADLIHRLLREDDVAFDIGANVGWFTVLMGLQVSRGACHAFEPTPDFFDRLCYNCRLNGLSDRVVLNRVALGDKEGQVQLYTFANLGGGHTSTSKLGRDDYSVSTAPMTTLDNYTTQGNIRRIDLIKLDVEGAELSVLKGAESVFRLTPPPMWIIEMNVQTSRSFGYLPEDLLRWVTQRCPCRLFRVVRGYGRMRRMKSETDFEHADNVFCLPAAHEWRLG
ncbi:MAG: FkbM family methyltransferase [Verrucomicrobia bacterium]|nr:FkbM family methyltransferase [Verrucomicrobiota bacterium]